MFKDAYEGYDGLDRSLDMIRANPVPFALIGIGMAWLIASNTNVLARIAEDERIAAERRRAAAMVSDLASEVGARAGAIASDVAASVGLGEGSGSAAGRPLGHTGNPLVDEG